MEDIIFGLKISAIGISVVFLALILVAWIVSLFRLLEVKEKPTKKEEKKVVDDNSVPEEIIAAITAAVAVAIDKKHTIKKIRYHAKRPEGIWSGQGRATIMTSHLTKQKFTNK